MGFGYKCSEEHAYRERQYVVDAKTAVILLNIHVKIRK